ncbi:alpha/beta hydrolase-fold protein [Idiomarina sp.]|uniref:alpha/beta hydrolase-fold protein n=1 Tax=Idiomarina sp. TaxID=1874361 RepID=UPI003A8D83AF
MRYKFLPAFVCLMLFISMQASAKVRGESIIVSIDSEVLDESRELIIHLPNNYSRYTDTSYPVLYLTDGQRNFAHAAGTLDLLSQDGMAQEMIIVGITNTHRARDFTPTHDESYDQWGISGGADDFLNFIEAELKPFINSNYRTNNYAILSGHSLGGLLSVYALQSRPEMFQAYFAFSPSLWWDSEVIFSDAAKFLSQPEDLNKYLYVNMGNEGGQMLSAFERYKELLNTSNREGFSYDTNLDVSESHNTTALAGMSLAFQKQLTSLRPSGAVIEEGVTAIQQYYKDLSKKYGYNAKPSYKAINHAGYNALEKQDYDTAISIFRSNTESHPNKSDGYDSLADGYEAAGKLNKALEMRKKALAMSYKENVENNALKTRLDNLQQKISGDQK